MQKQLWNELMLGLQGKIINLFWRDFPPRPTITMDITIAFVLLSLIKLSFRLSVLSLMLLLLLLLFTLETIREAILKELKLELWEKCYKLLYFIYNIGGVVLLLFNRWSTIWKLKNTLSYWYNGRLLTLVEKQ